jgi:hypothetical protein
MKNLLESYLSWQISEREREKEKHKVMLNNINGN